MDDCSDVENEEDDDQEIEWQQILNLDPCASDEAESSMCLFGDDEEDCHNSETHVCGELTAEPDLRSEVIQNSDVSSDTGNESQNSSQIKSMELNDHKAGMEGLDKEKINKIIHDASKGSKFYENEMRKEQKVKERIASMKEELQHFTEDEKKKALAESSKLIKGLPESLDVTRTLVHVDMDAFYAAVEMRDNPALRNVPMAVGGNSMLCTSNYLARKYGVRAAMPGFIAKKLCPQLVIVPTHFDKYRAVSRQVQDIFREYDANFAAVSLDEAHLDLTDYISENFMKYEPSEEKEYCETIVEEMRSRIFEKTQLTASAGIACNTMLAKICSDMNKPNGQYYLKRDTEVTGQFVTTLPIRKINGIGRVTEQMLKALGIEKCEDLIGKRALLYLLFSRDTFQYFMNIAHGISSNRITHGERKSMSAERTFQNVSNTERLLEICHEICRHLEEDLKKENLKGYNVTLKYKLSSFVTKTRSKTVSYAVHKSEELFEISKNLLLKEIQKSSSKKLELRLMGIRVCNFESGTQKQQKTMKTMFSEKKKCISQGALNLETDESMVPCPICGKLQLNKEVSLNLHIDKCLEEQETREIQHDFVDTLSQTKNAVSQPSISSEPKSEMETLGQVHDLSCGGTVEYGQGNGPMSETGHNARNSAESNENFKIDETAECPICGELQTSNETAFNIHLDECLSKSAISRLMENEGDGGCSDHVQDGGDGERSTLSGSLKRKGSGAPREKGRSKKVTLEQFWRKK